MSTHEEAAANQVKIKKLQNAFGIVSDYRNGESFNKDMQEQRREERKAKRQAVSFLEFIFFFSITINFIGSLHSFLFSLKSLLLLRI